MIKFYITLAILIILAVFLFFWIILRSTKKQKATVINRVLDVAVIVLVIALFITGIFVIKPKEKEPEIDEFTEISADEDYVPHRIEDRDDRDETIPEDISEIVDISGDGETVSDNDTN